MPNSRPIKVLVTGFGPFPGVVSNPSGDLLGWIDARRKRFRSGVKLRCVLVPTSWSVAERFVSDTLNTYDPDIALHFGVYNGAKGFRIEKFARNCASTQADADGQKFTRVCLVSGVGHTLRATIDVDRITARLHARGLPASISVNAGRYLCNALLFHSLHQGLSRKQARQTGFIHIPPLASGSSAHTSIFDKNILLAGAELIIETCVSTHRRTIRTGVKHDD